MPACFTPVHRSGHTTQRSKAEHTCLRSFIACKCSGVPLKLDQDPNFISKQINSVSGSSGVARVATSAICQEAKRLNLSVQTKKISTHTQTGFSICKKGITVSCWTLMVQASQQYYVSQQQKVSCRHCQLFRSESKESFPKQLLTCVFIQKAIDTNVLNNTVV